MSVSADRKPSQPLLSWSEQYQADIASVDTTFAEAGKTLVSLLPRRFERYPVDFRIKRGRKALPVEGASFWHRAQIEMTANVQEVSSTPEGMQRLFLDMGVESGDEIAIGLWIGRRSWMANPKEYPANIYDVTLVPTAFRPTCAGFEFNSDEQLWFLRSGTSVTETTPAIWESGSSRIRGVNRIYSLLQDGMVCDRKFEGNHAPASKLIHQSHPYLAAIHRAAADWIVNLVDHRMAS